MQKRLRYYQYDFEDVFGQKWETDPVPLRREKKDGQLSLEDFYDKEILGEESREEYIRRKFDQMGKSRIMVRRIFSGDYVEIDIYPVYLNRKDVPRSTDREESRDAQKKLNSKNSRKRLVRLMNANFHKGDLILTLTYPDGCYPTLDRAKRDMKNYIGRLKRRRKKQGLPPLKYIYVMEYVPEKESTRKIRVHHHMIINRMDRDEAEQLWGTGRVESRIAQPDDFELEGFATYISKLSFQKGHHKWAASKNLDKPKEYKSVTKLSRRKFAEIIKSGDGKAELLESLYRGQLKYLDSTTYISREYGGFYLHSRLRRKVSIWEEEENVSDKENALCGGHPDCRVFLEYDWKGTLGNGEAAYSILMEAMYRGKPVTRQYFGRISNTTKNRAVLRMAKIALEHLKPCSVEFHSQGTLLSTGITLNRFERQRRENYKGIRNAELIEELMQAAEGFTLSAVSEKTNEYSEAMKIQRELKYRTMLIKEDKRSGK